MHSLKNHKPYIFLKGKQMNTIKGLIVVAGLCFISTLAMAKTVPFDLHIQSQDLAVHKSLELSDVGEGKTKINFDFADANGNNYSFDLKYSKLADNRSYPTNLDITVKDGSDNKLGYLFYAINDVDFLRKMGNFGIIIDVNGSPMDIKFTFDEKEKGTLKLADLENERFVQDTLVSKFGFQMIRPVIVPMAGDGIRSVTYALDHHPYSVNYTIKDMGMGRVEFQHNLYATADDKEHLLERIYFTADSLETLRESMYAGKYFEKNDGTFKLVFYPAMGQTEPKR
jgi:hypothetical protein